MFSRQHWQIKLVYASFGFLFAVIGMLLSPVTAQRDNIGEIECTRLVVVDPETGKTSVILSVDEHGGNVIAWGKDGILGAWLGVDEHGGSVSTYSKDGKSVASLPITEHGGHVQVNGKGEGEALMSINEYGNGVVITWDKNGNPLK